METFAYIVEVLTYFLGTVAYCFAFLAFLFDLSWFVIVVLFTNPRLTKKAVYFLILLVAMYNVRCHQAKAATKQQTIKRAVHGW